MIADISYQTEFDNWDELIHYVESNQLSVFDIVNGTLVFTGPKLVGTAVRTSPTKINVRYQLVVVKG